jgi:hypothetical protein
LRFLDEFCAGRRDEVWKHLSDLGEAVREPKVFADAQAVAREAMARVRRNVEVLIARWQAAGHRFGYEWAGAWASDCVKKAPPLLWTSTPEDILALDQFEREKGPLPIVLRAFYEHVGAVNFVGTIAEGWPDEEALDPLQVERFTPQLPDLLLGEVDEVLICPDFLHKYFISGVGGETVRVPDPCFDPVLVFEGEELQWEGQPLRFGRYLREVILRRGGIGLTAGCNDDAPDEDLLAALIKDLEEF